MGIDYPNWLLSWFGFFIFVISTTPSRPGLRFSSASYCTENEGPPNSMPAAVRVGKTSSITTHSTTRLRFATLRHDHKALSISFAAISIDNVFINNRIWRKISP